MDDLAKAAALRKAELDRLRARAPGGSRNFERSQDTKLTFTSNAIEGNTLTAAETTLAIEHGITVAGRPLRDHMEAIDHHVNLVLLRGGHPPAAVRPQDRAAYLAALQAAQAVPD